jgi:hypothetical protein
LVSTINEVRNFCTVLNFFTFNKQKMKANFVTATFKGNFEENYTLKNCFQINNVWYVVNYEGIYLIEDSLLEYEPQNCVLLS